MSTMNARSLHWITGPSGQRAWKRKRQVIHGNGPSSNYDTYLDSAKTAQDAADGAAWLGGRQCCSWRLAMMALAWGLGGQPAGCRRAWFGPA